MIPFSPLFHALLWKKGETLKRLIFLEHQFLQSFGATAKQKTDFELIENVNKAIKKLDPELENIIRMRFFQGLSISDISKTLNLNENEIVKLIYEGKRQLKMMLADFVKERWNIEPTGICRVCVHPEQEKINNILSKRKSKTSWAVTIRQIENAIGEKITPPQILKAHLNHIKKADTERRYYE